MALDLSQLSSLSNEMSEQKLDIYIEKVIPHICDSWHCLQLSLLHFFSPPCLMVHAVRFNMLYMSWIAKNLFVETSPLIVVVFNRASEQYPIVRNNGCERTCTTHITFLRAFLVLSTYLIRVHQGLLVSIYESDFTIISPYFLDWIKEHASRKFSILCYWKWWHGENISSNTSNAMKLELYISKIKTCIGVLMYVQHFKKSR